MTEGWHNQEYLVLFDGSEIERLNGAYALPSSLRDYRVIGLCGWDDFILQKDDGHFFRIPSVPLDLAFVKPLAFEIDRAKFQPDSRFVGKIKWYIKPLVFGGDATDKGNMAWLSLDQHIEAVKWWNKTYRELKPHVAKKPA